MSFEFFGSFFVLFLAAFNWRPRLVWSCYVAAFAIALYFSSYLCLFVAGMICCKLYMDEHFDRPWVAVAGAVGIVVAIGWLALAPNAFDRPWFSAVILLSVGLISVPAVRRILSGTLSAFLGRWSFSIYLAHAIVLLSVGVPLMGFVLRTYPGNPGAYLAAGTALTLLAILSGIVLLPFDRLAIRSSRRIGGVAEQWLRRGLGRIRGMKMKRA